MKTWSAWVNVKWTKEAPVSEDWNFLKEWKEVKWAGSTMGDWDMSLWIDVSTPEELETFVHTKLRSKNWVSDTQSTWTKEIFNAA